MTARKAALVLGAVVIAWLYIHSASPSVSVGDSGEFMAAAATLGLPHAPSYPLFTLLGKCAAVLNPFGAIAYRINILSALMGVLTALLAFFVCRRTGAGGTASALAALTLAFSNVLWEPSLTTEVFTLNSVFACAVLLVFMLKELPLKVRVYLGAFIFGLGIGNHHTLVFVLAAVGLLYLFELRSMQGLEGQRMRAFWSDLGGSLIFFAMGFSIYIFLPVRSMRNPVLDWSNPETFDNFMRVIMRKDYGSFSLTLGEKLPRNWDTFTRQTGRYLTFLARDFSTAGALCMAFGWAAWFRRDRASAAAMLVFFAVSGLGFLLLGNLPFDSQSTGILGRFYLMPAVAGVAAISHLFDVIITPAHQWTVSRFARLQTVAGTAICLCLPLFLLRDAHGHRTFSRHDYAAHDYGHNLLNTLPSNTALFMDGGDDTFYTLAYFTLAENRRPDLRIHDRGGLIFRNPYGDDFRKITKPEKTARRQSVESSFLGKRPLYYSTFDTAVMPGAYISQRGILYEAVSAKSEAAELNRALWNCYSYRGIYEPVDNYPYRLRALVPLYAFMQASQEWNMPLLKRSSGYGTDILWLQSNLVIALALKAYEFVQSNRPDEAVPLYRFAIEVDPKFASAYTNLGVIAERKGDWPAAESFYAKAIEADPNYAETYYNCGALYWRQERWGDAARMFEMTVRHKPDHPTARRFLVAAQQRLAAAGAVHNIDRR